MGKWNSRWIPHRRSYNRGGSQRDLPPTYPPETYESNVPSWERKFCYLVGAVPWRKIMETKTFASCYPDVVNWDASEAEGTYYAAKKRFWAEMNGLPTDDFPLPDSSAYIDKVDWSGPADQELLRDLERALSATDEYNEGETQEGPTGVVDISVLIQTSKWQDENQETADELWNDGDVWGKSNGGGWGASNEIGWGASNEGGWGKPESGGWGKPINASRDEHKIANTTDTPWERSQIQIHEPVRNTAWGDRKHAFNGWRQAEHSYETMTMQNVENRRDNSFQGHGAAKRNGGMESGDRSWGKNHNQNNFKETKTGGYGSVQNNGASAARECGWAGDTSKGVNSWNNRHHTQTVTEYNGIGNWGSGNRGYRKRDSSNMYAPSKSPRFQRTDVKPWRTEQSTQHAGSSLRPS